MKHKPKKDEIWEVTTSFGVISTVKILKKIDLGYNSKTVYKVKTLTGSGRLTLLGFDDTDWTYTRLSSQAAGNAAADWLRAVADMVTDKGKSYGDSIGNPVRIFSQAGKTDGIKVRIDDKLSRIAHGKEYPGEDTIKDLVGYLALLAVSEADKT